MRNDARPIGEALRHDHSADRQEDDIRDPAIRGRESNAVQWQSHGNRCETFERDCDPGDEETVIPASDSTLRTKI